MSAILAAGAAITALWGCTVAQKSGVDTVLLNAAVYTVDDEHSWAEALAIDAGIDADTPNPVGGVIERDPAPGKPTGTLRDTAMTLVGKHTPPDTDESRRDAAFVMRLDDVSGSLEVGKSADLIVLDRNLFKIEPSEISEAKVLMTMLDGRNVFSNDAHSENSLQCTDKSASFTLFGFWGATHFALCARALARAK